MEEIKITNSAYKTIEVESFKCDIETGGLLIGTLNNLIVLEATPPGKNADLGFCHFTADIEAEKLMLDDALQKYNGKVCLMGHWHKHPGTMYEPSSGDLKQAQEIVRDIAQSGDKKPLILFIVNVIDKRARIYAYSLSHGSNQFELLKLILVDDNSDEIRHALENEPVSVQTKTADFWIDPDFQFYFTKRGKIRMQRELKELEATGYKTVALRRASDSRLLLDIQKGNLSLSVIPPVEYPLGAPRIIDKQTGKEIRQLQSLWSWNSDFTIKQVLDEILKKNRQVKKKPVKKEVQSEGDTFKTLLRGTFDYARFVQKTIGEYLWHSKAKGRIGKHFTYWA